MTRAHKEDSNPSRRPEPLQPLSRRPPSFKLPFFNCFNPKPNARRPSRIPSSRTKASVNDSPTGKDGAETVWDLVHGSDVVISAWGHEGRL